MEAHKAKSYRKKKSQAHIIPALMRLKKKGKGHPCLHNKKFKANLG